eukprot:SAG22_NODE_522_length_9503_cov_4.233624_8_plen_110_part_00
MGRKGKTQKHTAAELQAKANAAKYASGAAGGGGAMQANREAEKQKSMVPCELCKAGMPVRLSPPRRPTTHDASVPQRPAATPAAAPHCTSLRRGSFSGHACALSPICRT